VIAHARPSVAHLINGSDPSEIAFGVNATSFIRLVSLAVGQTFGERNETVVTDLDREANIATGLALEPLGEGCLWWKVCDDGALHLADLEPLPSSRTRLVACAVASNTIGSVVDLAAVADRAHALGAEGVLAAVHYVPHALIDVQAFDCDYLVCSVYELFLPHMGFLWGRREALTRLRTFREDFIPNEPPGQDRGRSIHLRECGGNGRGSGISGGGLGNPWRAERACRMASRREKVVSAMPAIRAYEASLSREMLRILAAHGANVHGVTDPGAPGRAAAEVRNCLTGYSFARDRKLAVVK